MQRRAIKQFDALVLSYKKDKRSYNQMGRKSVMVFSKQCI